MIALIDGIEKGKASSINKKVAKQLAAEFALREICGDKMEYPKANVLPEDRENIEKFDYNIAIDDDRILAAPNSALVLLDLFLHKNDLILEWKEETIPKLAEGNASDIDGDMQKMILEAGKYRSEVNMLKRSPR